MRIGYKTSEFGIVLIVDVVAAIVAIFAARGLIASEEAGLWVVLAEAVALVIAPIVAGIVSRTYVDGRARLKIAFINANIA